jgi:hypothetical protein
MRGTRFYLSLLLLALEAMTSATLQNVNAALLAETAMNSLKPLILLSRLL